MLYVFIFFYNFVIPLCKELILKPIINAKIHG